MTDTEAQDGDQLEDKFNMIYDEDRVLEDPAVSYILISIIIIIIISFLSCAVFIVMFIKHRSFCQHRKKSKNEKYSALAEMLNLMF